MGTDSSPRTWGTAARGLVKFDGCPLRSQEKAPDSNRERSAPSPSTPLHAMQDAEHHHMRSKPLEGWESGKVFEPRNLGEWCLNSDNLRECLGICASA